MAGPFPHTFSGTPSISVAKVIAEVENLGQTLVISWGPSPSDDVKFYIVDVGQESGEGTGDVSTWAHVAQVFAPTTAVRVTGLVPSVLTGKRYRFRIRAVDSAGNESLYTMSGWFIPIDITLAPSVPTGLSVVAALESDTETTTASITATWNRVTSRDLSHYLLDYYKTDGTGGVASINVPAYLTSYTIAGLKTGVSYSLKIRSVSFTGKASDPTTVVSITTPTAVVGNNTPGAPTLVSLSVSDSTYYSQVTLTIEAGTGGAGSDEDLSHHSIRRSDNATEGPEIGTKAIAENAAVGTSTTFVDSVPRNSDGTSYTLYYTVRTMDQQGAVSAASTQLSCNIPGYYSDIDDPRCPVLEAIVPAFTMTGWQDIPVSKLQDWHWLASYQEGSLIDAPLKSAPLHFEQECMRVETPNGCALEVSLSTPFILKDGSEVIGLDVDGKDVLTFIPGMPSFEDCLSWEKCSARPVGKKLVAKVDLGGKVFAAGMEEGKYIFSHNLAPDKLGPLRV